MAHLPTPPTLKITAVGDGTVGKNRMLRTYAEGVYPEEYVPTVYSNYPAKITVDNIEYTLDLVNTAGQDDYQRLWSLWYQNTDCFLLCYDVSNKSSLKNLLDYWYPGVKRYMPHTPIILVGTKVDLRAKPSEELVTIEDVKKIQKKIKAYSHVECSAKENINLEKVLENAVRAIDSSLAGKICSAKECILL